MYFMVDAAGTVLAVNPFGAEMLGYRVDELVGQPVLSVFHASDREAVQRHVAQCLRQLGRANSWEARKVRKDGTVLWVRETAKAVPRANGPIVLIACEDMTAQRSAAEALHQAQADLAHVSRVTTLGEMAASIAHEVDQPLSGVVINANACLRFLTGATPDLDEVREGLQAITRDGRRASDVIGRIRFLARRTTTEKQPLDINDVIREVVALAEGEAHRTRARLRTELAGDLPRVLGDPVQLQQVVLNLLLNGLEAMHAVVDRPRELVIRTATGSERWRPGRGAGLGIRHRPAARAPHLRRVLHHEAQWDGDGPVDQPVDCRAARRTTLGRAERRSRHDLPFHPVASTHSTAARTPPPTQSVDATRGLLARATATGKK